MGGMDVSLPRTPVMFRRAVVLKCPHCGSRRNFIKRWVQRRDRCRTCGIGWHREHGFELGPTALNVVLTFFCLGVGMLIAFALTLPDIPVAPLMVGFVAGAILLPLFFQPFTCMIWLAFDLATHKPDDAELEAAAQYIAGSDVEMSRKA
ncbi:MAG: hypothetical protein RJB65_586 [Actinomycetota bacterium]